MANRLLVNIFEAPTEPRLDKRCASEYRGDAICELCCVDIRPAYGNTKTLFATHESGRKHIRAYECLMESWKCYRADLKTYELETRSASDLYDRAFAARMLWAEMKLTTRHDPWRRSLKAAIFDLELGDKSESDVRFLAKKICYGEVMSLIMLAFIKNRATAGGQMCMNEVRATDSLIDSRRPWHHEFIRLISMDGNILMECLHRFLAGRPRG